MVFFLRVLQLAPAVTFGAELEVGRNVERIRANMTIRAEFLVLTPTDLILNCRIFNLTTKESDSSIILICFNYNSIFFKCCAD